MRKLTLIYIAGALAIAVAIAVAIMTLAYVSALLDAVVAGL